MAIVNIRSGVRRGAVLIAATGLLSTLLVIGPLAQKASAASLPVSNEAEFIAAMATAATNGEDDTITIMSDFTWSGNVLPTNYEAHALTIESDPGHQYTIAYAGPGSNGLFDVGVTEFALNHVTFEGFTTLFVGAPSADNTVSFDHVNVLNGNYSGTGAFSVDASIVTIDSSMFTGNSTASGSGAVFNITTGDGAQVSNSTFTGNSAAGDGGAIYVAGNITIDDSTFEDNHATAAASDGGAIYAEGDITVTDTDFTNNDAGYSGGALYSSYVAYVTGGTFLGNSASDSGGAVYAVNFFETYDATFNSNTADLGGALYSYGNDDSSFIENSSFDLNQASSAGGAIFINEYGLDAINSTFRDNSADNAGGAILVSDGGVDIIGSLFDSNTSSSAGGAVAAANFVTAYSSTFVGNEATEGGAVGGAIFNEGAAGGYTEIRNSTFTGNVAQGTGGAIYTDASGAVTSIYFSTFSGNETDGGAAAHIWGAHSADFYTFASVYVNALGGSGCDLDGTVYGLGAGDGDNFDADGSCTDDWSLMDDIGNGGEVAALGALADNQGPTPTMLPGASSDLIDHIDSTVCEGSMVYDDVSYSDSYDERGVERPQGAGCDIGAVETIPNTTFEVVTPGGTIHVTATDSTCVDFADAVPLSAIPATPPAGVSFPFGTISFGICVPEPGWTSTITLSLPSPVNQLWKTNGLTWTQVTGAHIVGTTVTYDVTDGGALDEDTLADAFITDPVGPARGAGFTG